MEVPLTCKYSLSVKFFFGHQAVKEDKDACAAEYIGESCEDAVTVLLGINGDIQSRTNKNIFRYNTISAYSYYFFFVLFSSVIFFLNDFIAWHEKY